eukprot:2772940-Amphidinium_carterae.1
MFKDMGVVGAKGLGDALFYRVQGFKLLCPLLRPLSFEAIAGKGYETPDLLEPPKPPKNRNGQKVVEKWAKMGAWG